MSPCYITPVGIIYIKSIVLYLLMCILQKGYTPLSQAAQDGHADFINMMINHQSGLDLNYSTKVCGQTWSGQTEHICACSKYSIVIVLVCNVRLPEDGRL